MPTPFTHLEIAQRLLRDPDVPPGLRAALDAERSAYLLGSVAADARVGSGMPREHTHFYRYDQPMRDHPWRVMVEDHPSLMQPQGSGQRAFVAGYVAHLSVDETWSLEMVGPRFAQGEWGESRAFRFYMLHMILVHMDRRDLALLDGWQADALCRAQPAGWLPFIGDDDLRTWRDLIYDQIKPEGRSLTLEIFGERLGKNSEELRAFLESAEQMQRGLWDHITPAVLVEVEAHCYANARTQMIRYWQETEPAGEIPG